MSHSLALYYATMTGNAESLARRAETRAVAAGWSVQLLNLSEVRPADLAAHPLALFIVSTWGDGEPPADAADFHADLQAASAPALPGLHYAVLGLGDRDYPEFNAFARQLDTRLTQLGAIALLPRVEADLAFEEVATTWEEDVFHLLAQRAVPAA